MEILDDDPLFFLINAYTTGFPPTALENILASTVMKKHPNGVIEAGENTLPISASALTLPCGIYGRWVKK